LDKKDTFVLNDCISLVLVLIFEDNIFDTWLSELFMLWAANIGYCIQWLWPSTFYGMMKCTLHLKHYFLL